MFFSGGRRLGKGECEETCFFEHGNTRCAPDKQHQGAKRRTEKLVYMNLNPREGGNNMKSRVNTMAIGILVIALASVAFTIAEAYKWNASPPCKVLSSLLECSDRGKQPLVTCLFNRMSNWLGLTAEQKGTIKAILTDEIPDIRPLLRLAFENRQELESITVDGRFVEAEVRAVAQKQSAILVELIVIREQVKSEIYPILTPEQRDSLKALQAAIDERIQELISR
jgi:Spy/CpxP family protein refolding chaperone